MTFLSKDIQKEKIYVNIFFFRKILLFFTEQNGTDTLEQKPEYTGLEQEKTSDFLINNIHIFVITELKP